MRNNSINFNDPSGHVCSDPEDPERSCENGGKHPYEDKDRRYHYFVTNVWASLPEGSMDQNTITGGVNLFCIHFREYLFEDSGSRWIDGIGKIDDRVIMATILGNEVWSERNNNAAWQAALSAISNQYFSNRFLWPSANTRCYGNCSFSEQLRWLRDFSGIWKDANSSLASKGMWKAIMPQLHLRPTGYYWAWGDTSTVAEAEAILDKKNANYSVGPYHTGGRYFFVYGYTWGWLYPTPASQ